MDHKHTSRTIDLPDAKNYVIAVLSDTHGKPHPNLFSTLEQHTPSLILHAGDVGGLDLIKELKLFGQTIFVRGNIDPSGPGCPDSISLRIKLGHSSHLSLLLLHEAIIRLRLNREALNLLSQNPAQIVVYGHSHIPFLGMNGKTCLFNPGSAGPGRMGLPITMGFIEISSGRLSFKHMDLRTGKEWKPLTPSLSPKRTVS